MKKTFLARVAKGQERPLLSNGEEDGNTGVFSSTEAPESKKEVRASASSVLKSERAQDHRQHGRQAKN